MTRSKIKTLLILRHAKSSCQVKFTKEGSVSIEVEEKEDKREEDSQVKQLVVVKVKDTGIGLDSEILPKLFSKFATKSHHNHTGVGV